jgi:amino acid permease
MGGDEHSWKALPQEIVVQEELKGLPQAFSIFGFAFYIQPMLLPLLHEMPGGVHGVGPLLWAVRVVIMGAALVTYVLLGFFGAARYGQSTQPNFLLNKWGGGGPLEGTVNAIMVLYMSITVPPMLVSPDACSCSAVSGCHVNT